MEERRGVPRWPINSFFLYQIVEEETTMSRGMLRDINLLGAKLCLKTEAKAHAKLKLAIEIPNQAEPIFVEGEVIWQNAEGLEFSTGIRFTVFKPADKQRILSYFDSQIRQSWWRE